MAYVNWLEEIVKIHNREYVKEMIKKHPWLAETEIVSFVVSEKVKFKGYQP